MGSQSSKCSHYFLVDAPREIWSLAVCHKCNKKDAFLNISISTVWDTAQKVKKIKCVDQSKREFLKAKGVKYWETYTIEKKKEVVQAVEELGIHQTARLFKIPISTVGLWAKGQSIHIKNSDKYTAHFKLFAIGYYLKERNFKKVARRLGVPRSTLQSWARKSLNRPH